MTFSFLVMTLKRPIKPLIYFLALSIALFIGFAGSVFAHGEAYEAYAPSISNSLVYVGGIAGGQMGAAIAHGDFNGDHIDDLAVSSPFASTGSQEWNGQVSIFYGRNAFASKNVDLSKSMADFNIYGEHSGDQLGTSLAVGDFNNDGIDDIAIGAHNAYWEGIRPGKVYVVYGQSTEARQMINLELDEPNIEFVGAEDGDKFGLSLSTVDVNDDHSVDLLIGAPNATVNEFENSGAVYAYLGTFMNSSGQIYDFDNRLADIVFYGQEANENFGSIIAGGNVTTNVYNDVIIGAYKSDVGETVDSGRVYIYKSLSENFSTRVRPTSTIEGVTANSWFGFSLDVADVNNDGIDDIAAGTFPYAAQDLSGMVSIFYGGRKFEEKHFTLSSDAADVVIEGDLGESILGGYIALEDLNNDEILEVIMGAPSVGYPVSLQPGDVFALYSSDGRYEANYDVSRKNVHSIIHGGEVDDWFGYSLDALDFNNDGNKDLVIGARYSNGSNGINNGKVFVLFGERKPYGVLRSIVVPEEAIVEEVFASRGELINLVMESFDLKTKKAAYLESCYEFKEFCLFNFLAMSSYDDVQLDPELILYPDVMPDNEYYDDIVSGTMLGLVNGYMNDEDSPFRPDAHISRIHALKVILGASEQVPLKYKFELVSALGSIDDLLSQFSYFADVDPNISYMWWYPRYINFAVENGLIEREEYFRPDDNITLDELNDLIMRTNEFINSGDEKTES